jgi:dTDP-4-amino-4,6-dideoxygalactose transaminase
MKIPYGKQYLDKKDYKHVVNSLKKPLLSGGIFIEKFENKISKFLKVKNVVACSSGTAALHMSFHSINLCEGDVVVMPAINFISSYNIAKLFKAKIFLADVNPLSGQMTPETLVECIKKNKLKKIKAIVTMYLGGNVIDLKKFYDLKKKYKAFLIEDACHAFGSKYKFNNKFLKIGSCYHSDICIFSFHPLKAFTTGEGGAVTTNDKKIYQNLKLFRSHGIKRDKKKYWEYDVVKNGLNYRISDINCSLGISQLNKINNFLSKRKKIAKSYIEKIKEYSSIKLPEIKNITLNSWHLFIISIDFKKFKVDKDFFFNWMNSFNIYPQYHYIPIYKFSIYEGNKLNFKGSEFYYRNSISLPIYYRLTLTEQKKILNRLKFFCDLYEKK